MALTAWPHSTECPWIAFAPFHAQTPGARAAAPPGIGAYSGSHIGSVPMVTDAAPADAYGDAVAPDVRTAPAPSRCVPATPPRRLAGPSAPALAMPRWYQGDAGIAVTVVDQALARANGAGQLLEIFGTAAAAASTELRQAHAHTPSVRCVRRRYARRRPSRSAEGHGRRRPAIRRRPAGVVVPAGKPSQHRR